MMQFLVIPVLLGIVTVSAFRANALLGVLCGVGLFAYMLAQPLGGFILWMGLLLLIWLVLKVLWIMLKALGWILL